MLGLPLLHVEYISAPHNEGKIRANIKALTQIAEQPSTVGLCHLHVLSTRQAL